MVTAWGNLLLAYRKASRGKRGKASAAGFEYCLADHLIDLQTDLLNQTYQPGGYVHFTIHEPKRRKISAAPFRDRVVHHALCSVIEPIFERRFIFDSYANRIGKGTQQRYHHREICRPRCGLVRACAELDNRAIALDNRYPMFGL